MTIAHVQHQAFNTTPAEYTFTQTVTLTTPITANNCVLIWCGATASGFPSEISEVTIGTGSTVGLGYAIPGKLVGSAKIGLSGWIIPKCPAGTVINIGVSNATGTTIGNQFIIEEYSGVNSISPIGLIAPGGTKNATSNSSTAWSSGSTPSAPTGDLVVGVIAAIATTSLASIVTPTGFTKPTGGLAQSASGDQILLTCYEAIASPGTQSFGETTTLESYSAQCITLRASAPSGSVVLDSVSIGATSGAGYSGYPWAPLTSGGNLATDGPGIVQFDQNPTPGSTVIIALWQYGGGSTTITSVVDNGASPTTFTLAKSGQQSTTHSEVWLYYAHGISLPSSGKYQVTVTGTGNDVIGGGLSLLNAKPGAPTATNSNLTTAGTATSVTPTAGAVTPAAAGAMVVGAFVGDLGDYPCFKPSGTSWTLGQDWDGNTDQAGVIVIQSAGNTSTNVATAIGFNSSAAYDIAGVSLAFDYQAPSTPHGGLLMASIV